jgi:hypothetical protein
MYSILKVIVVLGSFTIFPTPAVSQSELGPSTPLESTCTSIPSPLNYSNSRLPDPFRFLDGTLVDSPDSWKCRQSQIAKLFETIQLGPAVPKPETNYNIFYHDENATSATLRVNCSIGNHSLILNANIKFPAVGSRPYPVLIAFGAVSIPVPVDLPIATITFDPLPIARQGSSIGTGSFYSLYGSGSRVGTLMAWSWAVSRIIDAIASQAMVAKPALFDLNRIAVTGCSRYGKAALVVGAFDGRIALTIPQESGTGGTSCWRIYKEEQQRRKVLGVERSPDLFYRPEFESRRDKDGIPHNVNTLPIDQHLLLALIAPRRVLMIENVIDFLGGMSIYGCAIAGRQVYHALGAVQNIGYSQVGSHNHCSFPDKQQPAVRLFWEQFLSAEEAKNGSTEAAIWESSENWHFEPSRWMDWVTPTLNTVASNIR